MSATTVGFMLYSSIEALVISLKTGTISSMGNLNSIIKADTAGMNLLWGEQGFILEPERGLLQSYL